MNEKEARQVGPEGKSQVKRVVTRDGRYVTETTFHNKGDTEYRTIRSYTLPSDLVILMTIMILLIFLVGYVAY